MTSSCLHSCYFQRMQMTMKIVKFRFYLWRILWSLSNLSTWYVAQIKQIWERLLLSSLQINILSMMQFQQILQFHEYMMIFETAFPTKCQISWQPQDLLESIKFVFVTKVPTLFQEARSNLEKIIMQNWLTLNNEKIVRMKKLSTFLYKALNFSEIYFRVGAWMLDRSGIAVYSTNEIVRSAIDVNNESYRTLKCIFLLTVDKLFSLWSAAHTGLHSHCRVF